MLWIGIAYLVIVHFLWSTNNIAGRWLSPYIDPYTLTLLRWYIAALAYPLILGSGVFRGLKKLVLKPQTAVLGFLGFTLFNIVNYSALSFTTASVVGFAYGFTPVILLLMGWATGYGRPTAIQFSGALLSVLGVIALLGPKIEVVGSPGSLIGVVLGLMTGLIWSIYTVLQRVFFRDSDRLSLTYASLLVSLPQTTAAVAILGLFTDLSDPLNLEPPIWGIIAYASIVPGALAYYLWNRSVQLVGTGIAAPFSNLIPVFTAGLGVAVLGESLSTTDLVGGVLIVLGSSLVTIESVRKGRGR